MAVLSPLWLFCHHGCSVTMAVLSPLWRFVTMAVLSPWLFCHHHHCGCSVTTTTVAVLSPPWLFCHHHHCGCSVTTMAVLSPPWLFCHHRGWHHMCTIAGCSVTSLADLSPLWLSPWLFCQRPGWLFCYHYGCHHGCSLTTVIAVTTMTVPSPLLSRGAAVPYILQFRSLWRQSHGTVFTDRSF